MTIISRFIAVKNALLGKSVQLSAETTMQMLDRKTNQRLAKNYNPQPTKAVAVGDIGSDQVHVLAWQSQEAVINGGIWNSLTTLAKALKANDIMGQEWAVDAMKAWNYSAMRVSDTGNAIPCKTDAELVALVAKVVANGNKSLTVLPDAVLKPLARIAQTDFEQYKADHVAQVKETTATSEALRERMEEKVVGHTSAYGCEEASMPAATAIDKIHYQMKWMATSWKDKALVATEIELMEADTLMLANTARKDIGKARTHEEGVLAADGLQVYEALRKSERELESQKDLGYEPDALQEAFAEAEQEIVAAEVKANRRRVIKAA